MKCKGPRQESLLRLLRNVLANGEDPDNLIVYAGSAKAARSHAELKRTISLLESLDEDETLVIQSGKSAGVFKTSADAPLVLMATSNLVGRWALPDTWNQLERDGLIMSGGYTAGAWQYIGSQGIVQGTYQTFVEAARRAFGADDLNARLCLTAGLGGMGGAQPLAIELAGGVALCVECDVSRIRKRIDTGYLSTQANSLDHALSLAEKAMEDGRPTSIAVLGNASEIFPEIHRRGIVPAIVTDQTSAHDPLRGYLPKGFSLESAATMRVEDPQRLVDSARHSIAEHMTAMLEFQKAGSIVFEYGNNIRQEAKIAGVQDAFDVPGFMAEYIRPLFLKGIGPFRWFATSGESEDIRVLDRIVTNEFPDSLASSWIRLASKRIRFQGLPARIGWMSHSQRSAFAERVNQAVHEGEVAGPIAFTRDHLDVGGAAQPLRETENLPDGSDSVADWVLLNALLNSANGADLVALHGGGAGRVGYYQSAGVTLVADGAASSAIRLKNVLRSDTGIGIIRYLDAGYSDGYPAVAEDPGIRGFASYAE